MPSDTVQTQDDEEKTIQLILESLHTLKRLSDLHEKRLREIANDNSPSLSTTQLDIVEEIRVADTISKLSDNSLRGFVAFLNRYYA